MGDPQKPTKFDPDAFMASRKPQTTPDPDAFMASRANSSQAATESLFGNMGGTSTIQSSPGLMESLAKVARYPFQVWKNIVDGAPPQQTAREAVAIAKSPELRTVANNADIVGGTLGAAGGPPGAIIGGATGRLLRDMYRADSGNLSVPTSRAGAVADVAGAGALQGTLQAAGNLLPAWLANRIVAREGTAGLARALDFAKRVWNPNLPTPKPQLAVPPAVQQYLRDQGINLTAGELSQPGIITSLEPVLAKTPVGIGRASEVASSRQQILNDALKGHLTQTFGGEVRPTSSEVANSLQNEASHSMSELSQAFENANEARAVAASGRGPILPSEAGQSAIDAALGKKQGIDDAAEALYNRVGAEAGQQGIMVPTVGSQRSEMAATLLDQSERAERAGKSHIDPALWPMLERLAGKPIVPEEVQALARDQYGKPFEQLNEFQQSVINNLAQRVGYPAVEQAPEVAFGDLKNARTAILSTLRQMRAAGQSDPTTGALDQLAKRITNDLEASLPDDLRGAWRQARGMTTETAEMFNSPVMRSMLREKNPVAPENIIRELLQNGNETGVKTVLQAVGENPEALVKVRRAAVDWVQDGARSAADILKRVDARPGLQTILGDTGYNTFRQSVEAAVDAERQPASLVYRKFLQGAVGSQQPEQLIQKSLLSPLYAERLSQMTTAQPEVRRAIASDMLERLVNSSMTKESGFNPVEFARRFDLSRNSLAKFIDPQQMASLGELSSAMRYLKFSQSMLSEKGSIAAKYKAFQTVGAGLSIGGAVLEALTGHKRGAALTAATGVAVLLTPRLLVRAMLSPGGAKMLAEGLHIPAGAMAQSTAWLARLVQTFRSDDSQQQPQ